MKIKSRLLEIDCLRGIAAISVVIFHFTLGQKKLNGFFNLGCTGVELFFMISGFVIFLTIEKTADYKKFLWSRFARLYPAYWVCVTITTLAIILWSVMVKAPYTFPYLKDYLVNLTMFQYYFKVKNIDGAYWSLIIELLFYLFILIVYLLKKLHKIESIGLFVVLICLTYGTVIKIKAPIIYSYLGGYLPLLVFFPLFIAGIVFYKIKFYEINARRVLLLALCFITQILLFDSTGKIVFISQTQYVVIIAVFFVAFFLYCFGRLQFIINRVTLFTGKISYSLYLIHDFISASLLIPLLTHSKTFHINFWVAVLIIVMPIMLISAALINKFVEVPAMKYLKEKRIKREQLLNKETLT